MASAASTIFMLRLSRMSQCCSSRTASKHSMEIQPARLGPDHDQAAIIRVDANLAKREILGNRIIRAIPGAVGERRKRCLPYFRNPVVIEVFHRTDREIDGPVDVTKARAAAPGARRIDHGQKLHRRTRRTAFPLDTAAIEDLTLDRPIVLHLAPVRSVGVLRRGDGGKAKRFNSFGIRAESK